MFRREAKLMALIPLAITVVGFLLALIGPRLIRVVEHRQTAGAATSPSR